MKKLLFVFNPHSGTGVIREHLSEVLDVFTKAGYEVLAYPTQCSGDAINKIREIGADFDRIVVAGGDGMFNEMINGVLALPKEVETGYIATGTVNDFAKTHKIPKKVVEAAQIAAGDNIKSIDVGKFGDKYYSYVAAFGIVTAVSYKTKQSAKNRWKVLAYVWEILKSIGPKKFKAASRVVRVEAGYVVFEDEFIFGAVSNSKSIGTLKLLLDKKVELDDGLLEGLFLPRPKTLCAWIRLYKALKADDFTDATRFRFVRAPEIKLTMKKTTPFTLDGEDGGEHESVTITAQKQVLKIALPGPEYHLSKKERKKLRKKRKKEAKRTKKEAKKAEKIALKEQKKAEKLAKKQQKK